MRALKAQHGFTLLELVVVVVIIGIVSYVAVSNYGESYTNVQYQTLIRKMASDVRYARELAITDGQGTSVFIDETNNRYYLKWADGSYIPNPMKGGDFIVQLGVGDLSQATITATSFSGGRLDFTRAGEPLNGGNSFTGALTLVELNQAVRITITANTGYLKIEEL